MRPDLHVTTRVLPGNRIELVATELPEGQEVEVTIHVASKQADQTPKPGILDLINSFRPRERTPEEWEEFDHEFQRERDAWNR
jgi:hypothetical protein